VGNASLANDSLPDDRAVFGRLIANRYLVEGPCERTPSSTSFRAYHLGLDRSVLLRILPDRRGTTLAACRRALAIADRVSALSNPHLGPTLDVGMIGGRFPFVVYEYSKGRSLAALLEETGPFTAERSIKIGTQLAGALETAHEAGVPHGSLQLDNFWLESLACRPEWVRVLGFGLSELPDAERDGASSGVFPSAARREGGAAGELPRLALRADIYAFGTCLYQLASGSPPAWMTPVAGARGPAVPPWTGQRAVARGLSLLIQRCLYQQPENAYQSLSEVRCDLERLENSAATLASEPPGSRPPVTAVHAPAPRARVAVGQPKVIVKGG
jgi:serine/threonine protein kinase